MPSKNMTVKPAHVKTRKLAVGVSVSPDTKKQFDTIVKAFSGEDPVAFCKVMTLVEEMDIQYTEFGGQAGYQAGQVLDKSIGAFARFIELAQEGYDND